MTLGNIIGGFVTILVGVSLLNGFEESINTKRTGDRFMDAIEEMNP